MAKRRKPPTSQFAPTVVYDRMGFLRQYFIAADGEGEEVILLVSDTTRYDLFTREVLSGQIGDGARYAISVKDPSEVALAFKRRALQFGATPEAIRLLGLVTPISTEEYEIMAKAEKLAPKADKEGLKKAAKAAPVGEKKESAGKRGNPEALAKAREAAGAKQEAFKNEKLTVLVKPKDTTLRGGRLAKLEFVANAKPKKVGDVLGQTFTVDGEEYTIDKGALNGMVKREHIKIG